MRKPNVILVITDDQGYGDLGCTGNPWIQTPHIDAFHDEAVCLKDFHVSPLCTPTRGALMSGKRPIRNGAWATTWGRSMLRKSEVTMANVFSDNGYKTGMFGKWHLGDNYPYRPQDRGFQHVVAHRGGGVGQTPDFWGNNYFNDTYFHNGKLVAHEGYCTDIWFKEAIKFIKANREQPFFAYIATNAPHCVDGASIIASVIRNPWWTNAPKTILMVLKDSGVMLSIFCITIEAFRSITFPCISKKSSTNGSSMHAMLLANCRVDII